MTHYIVAAHMQEARRYALDSDIWWRDAFYCTPLNLRGRRMFHGDEVHFVTGWSRNRDNDQVVRELDHLARLYRLYADDDGILTPIAELPIHRTEAGWPRCSTCDGGGCPDCTDPA